MKFKHSYDFRGSLQIHFAGVEPDWQKTAPNKRNPWQRFAAKTKGVVTPGNAVSLLGAAVVLFGLSVLSLGEQLFFAIFLIAFGRSFDLIDGYIADVTGTKSLVGEAVDASLDKFLLFATLVVVIHQDYVPLWAIVVLFAQALVNAFAGLIAKIIGKHYRPVLQGKWATFASWATLLLFTSSSLLGQDSIYRSAVRLAAYISFILFCLYGAQATAIYVRSIARFAYKLIRKVY